MCKNISKVCVYSCTKKNKISLKNIKWNRYTINIRNKYINKVNESLNTFVTKLFRNNFLTVCLTSSILRFNASIFSRPDWKFVLV